MNTETDKKKNPWESPPEKNEPQERPDSEKKHPPKESPPERKRENDLEK